MPGFADKIQWSEGDELRAAIELIRERNLTTLWDVGANIGIWTLQLVAATGRAAVTSFEPDEDNLEWLRKNISQNGVQNRVRVRPVGVSDTIGNAKFWADKYTNATGSLEEGHDFIGRTFGVERTLTVIETTTLDAEVARGAIPPDFLKIDVEGHELAVLRGAIGILRLKRPVIVLEATMNVNEVTELLRENGYLLRTPAGEPMARAAYSTVCIPVN